MKNAAASLDRWTVKELLVVAEWAPELLENLAVVYNIAEKRGIWPDQMMQAYDADREGPR